MCVNYTENLLCSSECRDRRGSLLKPFQNLLSWVQSRWWAISTTNGRSSNCWSFCAAPLPPSRRRRDPRLPGWGDPIALAPWSHCKSGLNSWMEKYRRMECTTTIDHCEHHLDKSFAFAFHIHSHSLQTSVLLLLGDHDPLPNLHLQSITTNTKSTGY